MELVRGIKFRDGNIQNLEIFSDGAVAASRFDQDGRSGTEGVNLPIELDMSFAFKDIIELRHLFVVMQFAVLLDFNEVHRCDSIFIVHESPTRLSTGTGSGVDLREAGDLKIVCNELFLHFLVYAYGITFERGALHFLRPCHRIAPGNKIPVMIKPIFSLLAALLALLCITSCSDEPSGAVSPESPDPVAGTATPEQVVVPASTLPA